MDPLLYFFISSSVPFLSSFHFCVLSSTKCQPPLKAIVNNSSTPGFIHPCSKSSAGDFYVLHSVGILSINPSSIAITLHPSIHPSVDPSVRPSIHPSIHPSVHPPSVRPFIHPSFRPSIRPSTVRPFTRPSIRPSTVRPFIHPSIHPSIHPPIRPSTVRPFIHPSIHPFVRPSIYRQQAFIMRDWKQTFLRIISLDLQPTCQLPVAGEVYFFSRKCPNIIYGF